MKGRVNKFHQLYWNWNFTFFFFKIERCPDQLSHISTNHFRSGRKNMVKWVTVNTGTQTKHFTVLAQSANTCSLTSD